MSCTKHFGLLRWTHHSWRRTVSWGDEHAAPDTSMWGRPIEQQYVTCQKEWFCSDCGATKSTSFCTCDKERADQCAIYQAWLAGHPSHSSAAPAP